MIVADAGKLPLSLRERSAAVPRTNACLKITMPCRRSEEKPAKKVSTVDPKFTVLAESATDRP